MIEEFLTNPEIRDLTQCAGREAQCSALEEEGIPFKTRGKRILVSRIHARMWLMGEKLRPAVGPRLDLVR
jgi:hypothetical protein